jgi:thiamine kinase-like enzyme
LDQDPRQRVEALTCWRGPVEAEPLGGGITNTNFLVRDRGQKFVVRIGDDIPVHQIMRFNERAASVAAHAAGLSPRVVHHEPGALVLDFVEGRTFTPEDVRDPRNLPRIVAMIRTCHTAVARHLRGPALMFWPFHIVRDYAATLRDGQSRWTAKLASLLAIAADLERILGAGEIVFGHNDFLAGNLIDDGTRLWLIDWDYAGFNMPLFDLANLASNNGFSEPQERQALELYFGGAPGAALWHAYEAMRATSLLRETMWGMVSELRSSLDFDYAAYVADYFARFEDAVGRLDLQVPA